MTNYRKSVLVLPLRGWILGTVYNSSTNTAVS